MSTSKAPSGRSSPSKPKGKTPTLTPSGKGSAAAQTRALSSLAWIGVRPVTSVMRNAPRVPFDLTLHPGQDIFGIPREAFTEAFKTAKESWDGQEVMNIATANMKEFPDVPTSLGTHSLSKKQQSILYAAIFATRSFSTFLGMGSEESDMQGAILEVLNVFLASRENDILEVSRTSTNADTGLVEMLGGIDENLKMTAVKPDGAVGFKRGRVDFTQGDDSVGISEIQIYLTRLRVKVFYNLPMLFTNALFPYFLLEVKGTNDGETAAMLQLLNGMYLVLATWTDLAEKARIFDVETYNQFAKNFDSDVVYGMTSVGTNWKLWMLRQDPGGAFPALDLSAGSWTEPTDIERLFYLLEKILGEAEDRLRYLGVCLYCLRSLLPALAQKRKANADQQGGGGKGNGGPDEGGDSNGGSNGKRNRRNGPSGGGRDGGGNSGTSKRPVTRSAGRNQASISNDHAYNQRMSVEFWRRSIPNKVGAMIVA